MKSVVKSRQQRVRKVSDEQTNENVESVSELKRDYGLNQQWEDPFSRTKASLCQFDTFFADGSLHQFHSFTRGLRRNKRWIQRIRKTLLLVACW